MYREVTMNELRKSAGGRAKRKDQVLVLDVVRRRGSGMPFG